MLRLGPEKYASVHLQFAKVKPWVLAERNLEVLRENAGFVADIAEAQGKRKFHRNIFEIAQFYERASERRQLSDSEMLDLLGVRSLINPSQGFLQRSEFEQRIQQTDLTLMAERFLNFNGANVGAGRHVLLKNVHLKGVGRNSMAIQEEFSHSWGGLMVRDALKGYITDRYARQRSKLGTLEVLGLFVYDLDESSPSHCMLVRKSDGYRLAQIHPQYTTEKEKECFREHLKLRYPGATPQEMFSTIVDHYIGSYKNGIRYKSIALDNLLLDGRWIDTESIDINFEGPHDAWVSFKLHESSAAIKVSRGESILAQQRNYEFTDSWIHQLHIMARATRDAFKIVWPQEEFELEAEFRSKLEFYFSGIDLKLWFTLLQSYDSELNMIFGFPYRAKQIASQSLLDIGHLKLRGHFFNDTLQFHKLTFGEHETDPLETMIPLARKWEKVFWPQDVTFQGAHRLAQQIETMVADQ